MYQVFRVHRGSVLHVIHETQSGNNRTHGIYVLCRIDPVSGERDKGTATCPECLELDDPCDLTRSEINYLSRIVGNDSSLDGYEGTSGARMKLIKRDLIDRNNKLTRRGKILAEDWLRGPAPAASMSGVVHARHVLVNGPKCNNGGVLEGFDKMTIDRYERIRKLDLHVTCIACLRLQS